MGVYLRIRLPICATMQYAYTKKRRKEKHYIVHERKKREACLLCSISNEDFLKIVFISKRKGNNDLIPRKHAYNMRLGSLPSWTPSAGLFSKKKNLSFQRAFPQRGAVSPAFISLILTWSCGGGKESSRQASVDSTSQADRQWRLEWLHWNFRKSPGHSWCKDLGPPFASAFFYPKEHIA